MPYPQLTRRSFLQTSALAAAPLIIPAAVLGRGRPAPSERIRVGLVGCGGRGLQLLRDFQAVADCDLVAVCDVHRLHHRDLPDGKGPFYGLETAQSLVNFHHTKQKKGGAAFKCLASPDFRELCESDDIDAIIVATPDHWHAKVALEAIRHGKDVYCEKPVTHTFAEGQALIRAVKEHETVFQVGSQQRSEAPFRKAVEIVRNGHLGKVTRVEVGLPPGYAEPQGDTTITDPPEGLDYDFWCGPSPVLPYMRARHHRWWRGHRAYGGGVLMDWIGHHNDIAQWGLGLERTGPTIVETVDWKYPSTDVYNTPSEYTIRSQYTGDIEIVVSSKHPIGTKWIGDGGWLYVTRGKTLASNPAWLKDDFSPGEWRLEPPPESHAHNFVASIRSRAECTAPLEIAHRSITPGHLAYVSAAVGGPVTWDPATETITTSADADQLLKFHDYRGQWAL